MKVNPYLNFDGTTEEAFNFYKSVFGGEFTFFQRFRDMPESEQNFPEIEMNRIMHIALPIGEDTVLMGNDISEQMGMSLIEGNNYYISLHADSVEEGQRLFNALSTGGNVEMPFERMFWGDYFSALTDQFGVRWMVNVACNKEN